jgi:hypothetical protein
LPVLRKGSFATANDSLTYCSFAQWLQDHPFAGPLVWHPDEPIAFYPTLYREARAPLTPAFLLAGTQAMARASSPLIVYPALSTFGLVLAVGVILAAGRWMLRWPARMLGPLGLVVAALPHPLVWAHHSGFLAQTFGTPALLGILLVLARIRPSRRWRASEALLLASSRPGLRAPISRYSPWPRVREPGGCSRPSDPLARPAAEAGSPEALAFSPWSWRLWSRAKG